MRTRIIRSAAALLKAAAIALAASQPPTAAGARLQAALASASRAFADA